VQHANIEFSRDLGLRLGDVLGRAEAIEHNFRPGCCERTRDAETNAAGRSGNERNTPGKHSDRSGASRLNRNVHDPGLPKRLCSQRSPTRMSNALPQHQCRLAKASIEPRYEGGKASENWSIAAVHRVYSYSAFPLLQHFVGSWHRFMKKLKSPKY
jgi:hypothetical protein